MMLNVQLQLSPETIEVLRQRASAHGENLDVYISKLVAEEVQADSQTPHRVNSKSKDFGEWFKSWANRHPRVKHIIDDSRESIYAGCGE